MTTLLRSTYLMALLLTAGGAYAQVTPMDTASRPASAGTSPEIMGSSSITRPSGATSKATDKSLAENLAEAADFSMLRAAMAAAGLTDRAGGRGNYTVFAPTNAAFNKLPAGTLQTLMQPENKDKLVQLLVYHVVQGNLLTSDLKNGRKLKTVGGGRLSVRKENNVVMITDARGAGALVTVADIQAINGTVHAVDSVLMPQ